MMEVGVREGVWALVALLTIYLAVTLFRLSVPARSARWAKAGKARKGGEDAAPERIGDEAAPPQTVLVDAPPQPAAGPQPEAPRLSPHALNELELQQLHRDVVQLRSEQDFLRSELVAMRLDMNELQAARERAPVPPPQPQYVRPESPQHSEAMLLAGRGIAAAQIAEHCGISVAEAELVCALARAEGGA